MYFESPQPKPEKRIRHESWGLLRLTPPYKKNNMRRGTQKLKLLEYCLLHLSINDHALCNSHSLFYTLGKHRKVSEGMPPAEAHIDGCSKGFSRKGEPQQSKRRSSAFHGWGGYGPEFSESSKKHAKHALCNSHSLFYTLGKHRKVSEGMPPAEAHIDGCSKGFSRKGEPQQSKRRSSAFHGWGGYGQNFLRVAKSMQSMHCATHTLSFTLWANIVK